MSSSRFKGIFETTKETEQPEAKTQITVKGRTPKQSPTPPPTIAPVSQKRVKGKSSNPDFTQALAYVKKSTYKETKKALLDEPTQDFSDLVENLLNQWLRDRK